MSRILKISQGDYKVQVPDGNSIKLDAGTTGSVRVTGNLIVEGSTTEVQSTITTINDNVIILNKGETAEGITLGWAGIEIDRGKTVGTELPLSASLIFDETSDAFLLQTALDSTSVYADLYVKTINLDNISSNDSGITFKLPNENTTIVIDTTGTDYHNRTLVGNSIVTKTYLENYVSAEQGHATVNQIFHGTSTAADSQLIATATALEFYINEILIGQFDENGLSVNNIQSLTGNLTLNSHLESAYDVTFNGNLTCDTTGNISITSGTTGSIDNMSIGLTTPSDGKFNKVLVTTSATVPSGDTNSRPNDAIAGNIRYNTTIKSFEGYNGSIWGTVGGGLQSSPGIAIANYTALSNNLVRANTTNGGFTITLPDAPNDGDVVGIIDVANTFGIAGKEVTVIPGMTGTIEGTDSVILDLEGAFVSFVYITDVNNWKLEQTPTGPSSGSAGLTISNSRVISRTTTIDAASSALTFDGAAPSASNQLILQNDSTVTFSILVTARRTDVSNESAGFKFEGVIDRNTIAGTTNFVGTPVKTELAKDSASWDCNISIDVINGGLRITATGEANKTIKWVAVCNTAEVTG